MNTIPSLICDSGHGSSSSTVSLHEFAASDNFENIANKTNHFCSPSEQKQHLHEKNNTESPTIESDTMTTFPVEQFPSVAKAKLSPSVSSTSSLFSTESDSKIIATSRRSFRQLKQLHSAPGNGIELQLRRSHQKGLGASDTPNESGNFFNSDEQNEEFINRIERWEKRLSKD